MINKSGMPCIAGEKIFISFVSHPDVNSLPDKPTALNPSNTPLAPHPWGYAKDIKMYFMFKGRSKEAELTQCKYMKLEGCHHGCSRHDTSVAALWRYFTRCATRTPSIHVCEHKY